MQENKHRGCLSVLICLLATLGLPLIQLLASRDTLASLSQRDSERGGQPKLDPNGGLPGAQTDTDDVGPRFPRTAGARHPPTAAFVYIFPRGTRRPFLASLKEVSRAQSRLMSLEMRPLISFQARMIIDHLPQLAPTAERKKKGALRKSKQVKLKQMKLYKCG